MKVSIINKWKSDLYKGLENVYSAGEGSEVIITENINDETSLDVCKGPNTLEVVKSGC